MIVVAVLLIVGAMAALQTRWDRELSTPTTLIVNLDLPLDRSLADQIFPTLAIAPGGDGIVYIGGEAETLYYRRLDDRTPFPFVGVKHAEQPFFSSDGTRVGFVADQQLKIVRVDRPGEAPQTLCDIKNMRGASWEGDEIVYAPDVYSGLKILKVSDGSKEKVLTTLGKESVRTDGRSFFPAGAQSSFQSWMSSANGRSIVSIGKQEPINPFSPRPCTPGIPHRATSFSRADPTSTRFLWTGRESCCRRPSSESPTMSSRSRRTVVPFSSM